MIYDQASANYREPAVGFGIYAYAHHLDQPLRLTDREREVLAGVARRTQ